MTQQIIQCNGFQLNLSLETGEIEPSSETNDSNIIKKQRIQVLTILGGELKGQQDLKVSTDDKGFIRLSYSNGDKFLTLNDKGCIIGAHFYKTHRSWKDVQDLSPRLQHLYLHTDVNRKNIPPLWQTQSLKEIHCPLQTAVAIVEYSFKLQEREWNGDKVCLERVKRDRDHLLVKLKEMEEDPAKTEGLQIEGRDNLTIVVLPQKQPLKKKIFPLLRFGSSRE